MPEVNRQWRLARRPEGPARELDFRWEEAPLPRAGPGEALVRVSLLSLDPTNRPWMGERETYLPAQKLGEVMRSIAVGTVVESNNPALAVGQSVYGVFGWQDYALVGPQDLVMALPNDPSMPLTMQLGLFGHIGMTAYFGMIEIGKPQAGETVLVSGAAGAVGSLAGQIAKLKGSRVIGIAGNDEKCAWLENTLGFDASVNYRKERDLVTALRRLCPNGIDVYFDNVGGRTLEAALDVINLRGRIPLCGMISEYNEIDTDGHAPYGPRNLLKLVMKRVRMEGFLVLDYLARASEAVEALAQWHRQGRIKYRVHVIEGLESAPGALNMLFDGSNQGKLLVRI